MDWKKVHENIHALAKELNVEITEKEIAFIGGSFSIYSFKDSNGFYYELRHSKPESETGSRFSIYSEFEQEAITVKVKTNFWGRTKKTIEGFVDKSIQYKIDELANHVSKFSWEKVRSNKFDFKNQNVLKFTTEEIDLSVLEMKLIMEIHTGLA